MKILTRVVCGLLENYYDLPAQAKTEKCQQSADILTRLYNRLSAAMQQLDPLDRQVIQMLNMPPEAAQKRATWNGQHPTAAAVCSELGLTENQLRTRHYRALKLMQTAVFVEK